MTYVVVYSYAPISFLPFFHLTKRHTVVGHRLDQNQDKLVLFLPDGGVMEVSHWRDKEMTLGADWVLAQKRALEVQAGQPIPINL